MRSTSLNCAFALAALASSPTAARAQACCAGGTAVTPGRLAVHEDALAAAQWRAASTYGSFSAHGHYIAAPPGEREVQLEETVFAALRLFSRWQAAMMVPVEQTYRKTPYQSEWGGGLGDVNLGLRFDPFLAGEARVWPGVGILAGLTLPTGRSVESARSPLATDATGIGVLQGNLGVALEQLAASWLFGLSALAAKRGGHRALGVSTALGVQWSVLGSVAYTFTDETALALVAQYTWEGDAVVDAHRVAESGRRTALLSVAGSRPMAGGFRVQGSVFAVPPVGALGRNSPAEAGFSLALLRTWI